jgi:hypothetical protein
MIDVPFVFTSPPGAVRFEASRDDRILERQIVQICTAFLVQIERTVAPPAERAMVPDDIAAINEALNP